MSLLIGVRTNEGVVIAGDSSIAGTFFDGHPGRMPSEKFTVIEDSVVVGTVGHPGLSIRCRREVERLYLTGVFEGERDVNVVIQRLQEALRSQVVPELKASAIAEPVLGDESVRCSFSETLMVFPIGGHYHLFHFDRVSACTEATGEFPFLAAGPSRALAESFLSFLQRVVWRERQPTLDEALAGVMWTFRHAVCALPGQVSGPFEVLAMTALRTNWLLQTEEVAHRLQEAEALELRWRNAALQELATD